MRVLQVLTLAGLALAMTVGPAAAQSGTGTVAGRLVFCKELPRPVGGVANADGDVSASMDSSLDASVEASPGSGDASPGSSDASLEASVGSDQAVNQSSKLEPVTAADLADVTPGLRRFRAPGFAAMPAANIEVKVVGLPLSARTDANGQFVLQGVPAAQPITVAAALAPQSSLTLQMQNVVVNAGQTVDIGTLGLSGCAAMVLTPNAPDQGVTVVVQEDNTATPAGGGRGTDSDVPTPGHNMPVTPGSPPVTGSAE